MSQTQNFKWNSLTMGTCYYPEHWDKALWASDLERMLRAGITVVRIAEFAWSKVEPEEGIFNFDFFDEFLNLCQEKGMRVIFGTPTATPPVWLTEKYPEVLNARKDGVLYRHGARRHYNYNSSVYQHFSARIVEREAQHYASHPAIIGWQIDNEINCEVDEFYSEADDRAFRRFLQRRYRTLHALNEAWGTVFWNQTYTDWEQVHLPRTILSDGRNPHQHLDYIRFVSESAIGFCRLQAEILRKYLKKGDFITTNGMFSSLDNHKMTREALDIYMYDSYPNFAYCLNPEFHSDARLRDRKWSQNLAETRSICPHFGIMEQQSGANGWISRMEAPAPRPGQLELWALQSVAHGAEYVSFFRWRTCTVGTEIYWHGILDYDNRENRKYREVQSFYQKLRSLEPIIGSSFTASVGILKDYDNEWDRRVDVWHDRVASASEEGLFRALQFSHTPYDVVYLTEGIEDETLANYSLLIYPHPCIMTADRAALLKRYVEAGGCLLLGCRSGYKDQFGHCVMLPQPGLLRELTGTDVRDFTFVSPAEEPVLAEMGEEEFQIPVFCDILTPLSEETEVLGRYKNSYFKGEAVLTRHALGKGCTLHFGGAFHEENSRRILNLLGYAEPYRELFNIPEEVELVLREKNGLHYAFLLNYTSEEQAIAVRQPALHLFQNKEVSGSYVLAPYEAAVFQLL